MLHALCYIFHYFSYIHVTQLQSKLRPTGKCFMRDIDSAPRGKCFMRDIDSMLLTHFLYPSFPLGYIDTTI